MKSLGDFDYGFADRLRGIRYSGTGPDNKTYCDWLDEAADLLDECERALTLYYNLCENHEIDDLIPENAVRILDKLRSQEKADEVDAD